MIPSFCYLNLIYFHFDKSFPKLLDPGHCRSIHWSRTNPAKTHWWNQPHDLLSGGNNSIRHASLVGAGMWSAFRAVRSTSISFRTDVGFQVQRSQMALSLLSGLFWGNMQSKQGESSNLSCAGTSSSEHSDRVWEWKIYEHAHTTVSCFQTQKKRSAKNKQREDTERWNGCEW